jgi:hypothetical protein
VNQEPTTEDQALLAALATLEQGTAPPASAATPETASAPAGASTPGGALAGAGGNGPAAEHLTPADREAKETLARLYHEVLGLVPAALPPMIPRPEVKRSLMAAISGSEAAAPPVSAPRPPGPAAEPLPFPRQVAPAPAPPAPAPEHRAQRSDADGAPGDRRGRHGRRTGRSWLALAAALALALAGTCIWLLSGLREQRETIAHLSGQRLAAQQQVAALQARLAGLTAEVKGLRDSVAVVTSPAVEVCPLRPALPGAPPYSAAGGVLFVAADHQHWYMSLRGLRPPGAGKVYQLWFIADQGPVSAGTFAAESGAPWQLGSEHMPSGTRAVRVTLENGAGSATPNGPEILRNADAFRVL